MLAAIADISQWSIAHKLKLNPDKSKVIWLGNRQQLAKLSEADKSLQLPDGLARSSTTVQNLGVVIDERLSFDDQARSCIKSCYFHLRRLKQMGCSQLRFDFDSTATKELTCQFFAASVS